MKQRLKNYGRRGYFISLYVLAAIVVWHATIGAGKDSAKQRTTQTSAHELRCGLPRGGAEEGAPRLALLGDLPEASGLALSRRSPGLLWSMNDSADPVVVAFDSNGTTKRTVRIAGAEVKDWEDISVGPCAGGSCLYVADIGDNAARRSQVTVYRTREPDAGESQSAPADALVFDYPDGQHDAEAVFIAPDRTIYIVTKDHPTVLYRAPADARPGATAMLTRVAELPLEQLLLDKQGKQSRVTDAESSPNGNWVALRTNAEVLLFRLRDLIGGKTTAAWRADLRPLDEAQGEGIAVSDDGELYLAGEGGGKGLPGTFARVKCQLPR